MSNFSNNYLGLSYVLYYTKRLAFRKLAVISITLIFDAQKLESHATREAESNYRARQYVVRYNIIHNYVLYSYLA